MRFVSWAIRVFLVAVAAMTKNPPVPRLVKFNLHPFMKRSYAKVLAGGGASRMTGYLGRAVAVACLMALFLTGAVGVGFAIAHTGPPAAITLAIAPALVAKRNELQAKQKFVAEVMESAGDTLDFNKKEVLDKLGVSDSNAAVAKVREHNTEMNKLYDEVQALVEVEGIANNVRQVGRILDSSGRPIEHGDPSKPVNRGIGRLIVDSKAFNDYCENKNPTKTELKDGGVAEFKNTLMTTTAGFAPESTRSGLLVEAATRPIQVIDIIPMGTTNQAAYKYMEETTRTHASAELAENATYAESTFVWTERTEAVRKLGDSIPVTDEQLEDVDGIESLLDQRLGFGIRQRFDGQVLNGNAAGANLRGILNVAGIQTQAKGTDPAPDAFYKALTKVLVTGRATPSHALAHPTDWQNIRLLRTADGIYIWGSPSEAGPDRLWGLPVVKTDAIAQGTGLIGDFPNFCMAFVKRGIEVQVGYVNDQFVKGAKTIRADFRVVMVTFRPAAFCTVTGL